MVLEMRGQATRPSCRRRQPRPCCAALAPAPSSDCPSRQSLPCTVRPKPPGFRLRRAPHRLRPLRRGRFGLHPSPPLRKPARAGFSTAWPMREPRPTYPFNRSGLRSIRLPTLPSADFRAAVTRLAARSVRIPGHGRGSPEVSSDAFPAHPPDLPPRPLMTVDFAVIRPLVRPGRPRIRFLSIGSRLCSTLPSDPASRRRPCASLALRRHQAGQRTSTSKLSIVLGTREEAARTSGADEGDTLLLRQWAASQTRFLVK